MTKTLGFLLATTTALLAVGVAHAGDMYPWRHHAKPYAFLFGNHFDTHQQSTLRGDGSLRGYLYIAYTGTVSRDGHAIATHIDCNAAADRCVVGWMLDGVPAQATFSHHPMHDHPMFVMARARIPQPGGYSHFHWTGAAMPHHHADGYVLQLTAKNRFCFVHHGADQASSAATCEHNGGVVVNPGLDIATHLNIIPGAPHGM
jgi:hypothetical protein